MAAITWLSGFLAPAQAATNLLMNVSEAAGYTLVYDFSIPNNKTEWYGRSNLYNTDISSSIQNGTFTRVAYYLELEKAGVTTWVYVSMDSFTNDAKKIGVPTVASGALFTTNNTITNANIYSNAAGIVTGTALSTVKLEFWSSNYGSGALGSAPGASSDAFDFGDSGGSSATGYGSMQIHNIGAGAQQTLFALNAWGTNSAGGLDLGIGNSSIPRSGFIDKDWTFASNAATYQVKSMQVLVMLVPEPSKGILLMAAGAGIIFVRRRPSGTS